MCLLGGLLLIAPLPGVAHVDAGRRSADGWNGYVREASMHFGIPEDWIRSVICAESGGRTTIRGHPVVSRAGAMGLMQLMPATWAEMRERHGLGCDPHDPRDNILAGSAYLRAMHDRFGYPGLFAAYNAGPGRYGRHLAAAASLPRETIAYMAQLATGTARLPTPRRSGVPGAQSPIPLSVGLFAIRRGSKAREGAGPLLHGGGLFAVQAVDRAKAARP